MATKNAVQEKRPVEYATPALEKGLDILELLSTQPAGLTKSQIARELNRTVSEIFRMLLCLERRKYITQIAEDKFTLTLKLFQLVQQHPPTERLVVDAIPVMQRLAHDTTQSCHLGVLEGTRVVILAQQNASSNLCFSVKLGSTVDLMEASSGYVILAHQDQSSRARTIARWEQETAKRAPGDLELHLRRIRKAGFEKSPSYLVNGVVNISFPILDQQNVAVAALTIPYIQYNAPGLSIQQTTEHLRAAASEISAAIGGTPSPL